MLRRIENWFVSVDPDLEADLYWKSLIFVYITLTVLLTISIELFVIYSGFIETDFPVNYLLFSILTVLAIFKYTGDVNLGINLLILGVFIAMLPLSFTTGGIFSLDSIFLQFLPILAFLMGNLKSGVFWYVVISLCAGYQFYTTDQLDGVMKNGVFYSASYYIVITIAFYFTASSFAFVFSFLNNKYLSKVKNQNDQIRTQAEDLRIAQEKVLESNRELEQYAYVTSHDLKQPLRTIISFSKLLEKDINEGIISEDTKQYMNFIKGSANNMDQLIEDILEYSQLTMDQNEQYDYCPIGNVVDSAISNLHNQIQNSRAIIDTSGLVKDAELPLMTTRIIQLFQNIVSNGMKYRDANRASKITISSVEKDSYWLFTVSDNGIGIPDKHLTSIFQPFKRLHSGQQKFKGTGIGLATCDRIVEQHGGKIWVESEVEIGSKFSFTLSKTLVMDSNENDSKIPNFKLQTA